MSPEEYALIRMARLQVADEMRPRSRQKQRGEPGISDLFTCKEKVRRLIVGEPSGDDFSMAAFVGTAVDAHIKSATDATAPHVLTNLRLTLTLPSGRMIAGTADEVDPTEPSVTDDKTKDGLAVIARTGSDDQQRSQRHLYAAAVVQAGLVEPDGLIVRNCYTDRSGRYDRPWVEQEPYNPAVVTAADEWYGDVLYAVEQNETAEKNPALCPTCPYSVEKGGTCGAVERDLLTLLPDQLVAARLLDEARKDEKAAKQRGKDAKRALAGVEGQTEGVCVWWTHVNAASPYDKCNVTVERGAA